MMEMQVDFGLFVNMQKTSDTVDHQILFVKLNHYEISEISND